MKIKYSSVLEYSPLMAAQQYIWVQSLLAQKVTPNDIYVHIIGHLPASYQKFLETSGVQIVRAQVYNSENRYCNKLVQLDTFERLTDYDYIALMDCDTALVGPLALELDAKAYAKIVDFPCPPANILKQLFKAANLDFVSAATTFAFDGQQETEQNNCNGGFYLLSKEFFTPLAKAWRNYADWCKAHANLFTEHYKKHADQVGFAMAMRHLKTDTSPLSIAYNYPTHVAANLLPEIAPIVLHFHDQLDEHMHVKPVGIPKVDKAVTALNNTIDKSLEVSLNNSMFWDLRYERYPELGSGVGSRGDVLTYKKELLKHITYGLEDASFIDVGCGDLELTKELPLKNYLGLDLSNESVKMGAQKRPDWQFKVGSITDSEIEAADVVMCFDVLIHQSEPENFSAMVKAMVNKANKRLIIGAYNNTPDYSSSITYFYNPIEDEIKKHAKFDEIAVVGKYRDVSVVVASVRQDTHARDIAIEDLNKAFGQVSRPDLLRYLVDVSKQHLGFYTSHYPRVFEYSWILEKVSQLNTGVAVDLGAGVCPVPLCLSEQGWQVITVDSHQTKRKLNEIASWNEWGFLDYSQLDTRIKSFNKDFMNFRAGKSVDLVYSISVIEHIPAQVRRKILKVISRMLKVGGHLVLTIDLEPNTENLWNFSENKPVDAPAQHGTINSFKAELAQVGLSVASESIQKNIDDSRTDVYYIIAQKNKRGLLSSLFRKI